jgi:hypothetical protein
MSLSKFNYSFSDISELWAILRNPQQQSNIFHEKQAAALLRFPSVTINSMTILWIDEILTFGNITLFIRIFLDEIDMRRSFYFRHGLSAYQWPESVV